MAIALLAGNLILLSISWILIHRMMGKLGSGLIFALQRPLAVMAICFMGAAWAQNWIIAKNWLQLFLYSATVGGLTLLITFFIALPIDIRASLKSRLKNGLRFKGA